MNLFKTNEYHRAPRIAGVMLVAGIGAAACTNSASSPPQPSGLTIFEQNPQDLPGALNGDVKANGQETAKIYRDLTGLVTVNSGIVNCSAANGQAYELVFSHPHSEAIVAINGCQTVEFQNSERQSSQKLMHDINQVIGSN